MAFSTTDLRAVKAAAKNDFGQNPGVLGFGIGDGTLRIYVRDPETSQSLPKTYQGVPVEPVVEGDVVAYSSE